VDDDPATRAGLRQLLERAGYEVLAAGTFAEGKLMLNRDAPDLIIADIRLGEYNGLQLVVASPRPIPAIIITGYPDAVLEADARRLGAQYLCKPVSPPALLALVRQSLALEGAEAVSLRARRWERKKVTSELPVNADGEPARVLDISYGGLRLEVERRSQQEPPTSFIVRLTGFGLSVPVDLVWTSRVSEKKWLCGASVAADQSGEELQRAWYGLVDAVA
jgi:DNA-binding response OmpR family regulator